MRHPAALLHPRSRLALALGITALLCGCGGGAGRGAGGGAPTPAAATSAGAMTTAEHTLAEAVLVFVNQERTSRGLTPLTWHEGAAKVAYRHAAAMHDQGFFSHVDLQGRGPGDRLDLASIAYSAWGENIAYEQADAKAVVAAWMGSAGHRANILNPGYVFMGCGLRDGPQGPYWVQVFLGP